MPLVLNWASTWANQTVGSVGQNGGSLMLIAATVAGGPGGVPASPVAGTSGVCSSVTTSMVISSVLAIVQ